ncbi:MAG: hypothetical protein EOP41_08080, partial [Sphingobacteriaceae bacterium]
MTEFFSKLFSADGFPARWHCGNWTNFHGWLYIISDFGIWAAYFTIPILLLRVMIKRKDIPFNGVILLFLAFVFICGLTHLMDAVIFWWPAYRLSAVLRFATAIISIFAAAALNRVFPMLLALRSVKELKIEIARRKKTEERLSASEFLLSEAGRIAGVGGWEIDLVNSKRSYSKTIYNILEMPPDHNIQAEHSLSYYPEPYRALLEQALQDALQKGSKWDLEVEAVTLQNNKLWVRHIGEPVRDVQGKIVQLRGVVMNIDQYKKHELELSRALKASQEQKQQLKNFAYVLSHNIRNHTSNLSGLSAMINEEKLDEENKELFSKTNQVTRSLVATLDDLAEVIEAQDEANVFEQINFETVVNTIIEIHSMQIQNAGAQLIQQFEAPDVMFSRSFLKNIIQHLLTNAIQYRDPDQRLDILLKSYKNANGNVILECTDNGLGMDLERYGAKLFGLYVTFHPPLSGRGVGLYLIKTQIESLGGKISVSSQPGKG